MQLYENENRINWILNRHCTSRKNVRLNYLVFMKAAANSGNEHNEAELRIHAS
jgi:hypothetical protein